MKKEKSCGAVVYRQGETGVEVLIIKHKNGGHWAFPKGHVEKKETEPETALRKSRRRQASRWSWTPASGRWSPTPPSPT